MKYSTKKLTLLALLAALTFVLGYFTKIPIPGGYFTLLDAGIFTTAMLLGKREGLIVGALAGFLNDFIAGYAAYMFFTLVIHGLQGYLGVVTKNKALNYVLATVVMVGGYFVADMFIVGSLAVALPDMAINAVQTSVGFVVALLLTEILKNQVLFMDLKQIKEETKTIIEDVIEKTEIKAGQIFVLGLSSSEVNGGTIGKNSSAEIGEVIVGTIYEALKAREIYLAVQACEHLNRALLVEQELADKKDLEIVSVVPQLHAGGSGQVAAYKLFKAPVEVEHLTAYAGLDIGDTSIGMHIKHVQIPVRPVLKELGGAHVTALKSRPKLIGGERARYE